MKNFILALFLVFTSLYATEEAPVTEAAPLPDIGKVSEAFGHLIGKNLDNIGVKFDMAQVIKGLQDASTGKTSPMSEAECVQAIASVQETLFKEQSSSNLAKAEAFLSQNKTQEQVVSLENSKVQYKVDQAGTGAAVESHFAPLVRYTGKHLDGTVFGASKEDEMISLDEVIPGLKAGLLGMKEGEKRTIYIHPDMAYGTNGYLPPNSLLTFEVEVVKANAPIEVETVDSISQETPNTSEVAETETHVR